MFLHYSSLSTWTAIVNQKGLPAKFSQNLLQSYSYYKSHFSNTDEIHLRPDLLIFFRQSLEKYSTPEQL